MNLQSLRNAMAPRRRAWVVGLSLTLSLLVVAGFMQLALPPYAVAHASGSASSGGATVTAKIEPLADLNGTDVDVSVTWSCVLPQGALSSLLVITLPLEQPLESDIISSSKQYQYPNPVCDGVDTLSQVAVPSPAGQSFGVGTALASGATATLLYYTDATKYDLVTLPASLNTQDITIKAVLSLTIDTYNHDTVNAGSMIAYRIGIKNMGPGQINNVTVMDFLPFDPGLHWTIALESTPHMWSLTDGVLSLGPIKLPGYSSNSSFEGVIVMSPTTTATCGTVFNTLTATTHNAGTLSADARITVTCP